MNDAKLPILKPVELIKALEKLGFSRTRKSKGSHFRYKHPDGRKTTVPFHEGKDIGRDLLRKILPSKDVRIEKLARELCDYYDSHGPKPLGEKDALHLATAIHYRANAFYTFDSGGKGSNISLLFINGNVAGIYPLLICKPPVTQWRLFKP